MKSRQRSVTVAACERYLVHINDSVNIDLNLDRRSVLWCCRAEPSREVIK